MVKSNEERIKELVDQGKKTNLNNKELLELISLLGPDQALEAMKK
jgi:hypothetical protein